MTNDGLDLLEMVRRELAPTEGANRFVQLVSEGRLPSERLAAVAGEEYWIGESDRRSFLHLAARFPEPPAVDFLDRKSTRLNSSHSSISYAVFCLKKKTKIEK